MNKAFTIATMLALTICADPVAAQEIPKSAEKWEVAFQTANMIDAAQTCYVVSTGRGTESNPLFSAIIGKRPSCGAIFGAKAVNGLLHWLVFKHINNRNPDDARHFAKVSTFVQAGIVGLNMRYVW
jgi:hypothetical protein